MTAVAVAAVGDCDDTDTGAVAGCSVYSNGNKLGADETAFNNNMQCNPIPIPLPIPISLLITPTEAEEEESDVFMSLKISDE